MKIGIVTLYLIWNYGGILQAFALQKYLREMGHDVDTIVYKRKPRFCSLPIRLWKSFSDSFKSKGKVSFFHEKNLDKLAFNTRKFIKNNINLTEDGLNMPSSLSSLKKHGFEAFVVGSDQVWRYSYFKKYISNMYLDFLEDDKDKITRVAYAASFGFEDWRYPPEATEICSKLADKFDGISVRESSAVQLCKKYLQVDAVHVLDPTLLLTKEDYCQLIASDENSGQLPKRDVSSENCFYYILDDSGEKLAFIEQVSQKLGLQHSGVDCSKYIKDNVAFPHVTDWLRGFRDASFIITDSFHGTVFAILFNKPFLTIGNKKRGMARFNSFLGKFDLQERLVSDLADYQGVDAVNKAISWEKVNKLLSEERAKSKEFLKQFL
jgi:hypothetical protein